MNTTEVRIAHPEIYVDTNIWYIFEVPKKPGKIGLFKVPIPADLASTQIGGPKMDLMRALIKKFGPIKMVDIGNWYNMPDDNKMIKHPFTDEMIHLDKFQEYVTELKWKKK